MPKKLYEIKDFSGGLNAYADPRDIKDTEFSQNYNIVVDKNGILRVVGSAVEHITSSNIDNPSFKAGKGLYQFSVDYGWNIVDGSFDYGFEQGTVHAQGTDTDKQFVLEATASYSTVDSYYNGMTVFFYSAAANTGDSRVVSAYTGSSRTITLAADCTNDITTADKYMIFRWKSVDFTTDSAGAETDYITNGIGVGYETGVDTLSGGEYSNDSNYYAVSKITGVNDSSISGGYLEYAGGSGGTLTLKAGVEYSLSFYCGFKEKWRNIICEADFDSDGSGSDNYAGWVPWVELYSETVTNDGTVAESNLSTGLNLLYNGNWAKKTDTEGHTQNYKSNPTKNWLENGSFRLGTTHWTAAGTGTTIAAAAAGSIYGGHQGTATITTTSTGGNSNAPTGAIHSDNMALDVDSWYRLNFVYSGDSGVRYSIWNDTDSVNVIAYTSSGTSLSGDGFRYPFERNDDTYGVISDYIYFYIPEIIGSANTTRDIQVRLNSGIDNSSVNISGMTVRKAYNDLVTMSNSVVGAGNPFLGGTEIFTRYTTKFKVPAEYDDATDWVLRIHAGAWDYQDDGVFDGLNEQSQTQEVYIDNIRVSDNDGDVFTLLTSNKQLTTEVALHSENQGSTWDTLTTFTNANAELNYNYANGVLRISDGNFKTSNGNKMFYYSKGDSQTDIENYGWKLKDGFLLNPPDIVASSVVPEDELTAINPEATDIGFFDGVHHMNKLFENVYYTTPGQFETGQISDTEMPAIATDWKLDSLGKFNSTGIVTRYFWSASPTSPGSNHTPFEISNGSNYNGGWIATEDTRNSAPALQKHIVAAGVGVVYYDDDDGSRGGYSDEGVTSQALWPLKLICKADNYAENQQTQGEILGMRQQAINAGYNFDDVSDANYIDRLTVYKVEYDIDFEFQSWYKANQGGDANANLLEDSNVPYFRLKVGKLNSDNTINDMTAFVNSGDSLSIQGNKEEKIGYNASINRVTNKEIMEGTGDYSYTPGNCSITMVDNGTNSKRRSARYSFSGEMTWDINDTENHIDVSNSEDIVMTIKDELGQPGPDKYEGKMARVFTAGIMGWRDIGTRCNANLTTNPQGASETFIAKKAPAWNTVTPHSMTYSDAQVTASQGELTDTETVEANVMGASNNAQNLHEHASAEGTGGNGFALYTRYFVNKFKVFFHNPLYQAQVLESEAADEDTSVVAHTACASNGLSLFLDFRVPEDIAPSGWAERTFQIATTVVNNYNEESCLNISDDSLGPFPPTVCPDASLYLGQAVYDDENILKSKVYMKDSESDVWYLQFFVNHKENKIYSTVSGETSEGSSFTFSEANVTCQKYFLNFKDVKDFNEVNSYESESLVSQEDAEAENNDNLTARYKTSIIANNRLYVGNIMQNSEIHGDRMLKSPPSKYNVLPASNFIDVAINDGDEITALEFYKDRLIQFKKQKVFVINTSGDYEFLEDTFFNIGVLGQYSVVNTPHGVVWANKNGCYLYDGKKLSNLIESKIPISSSYANPGDVNNRWCANASAGDCVVGYDNNKETVLVNFTRANTAGANTPSGATYHFPTKSWSLLFGVWNNAIARTNTGNMSNMVTNTDGDIMFYHTSESSSDTDQDIHTIRKWNHESNDTLATKNIVFATKDITFGDINVRKKIYKVYVTYRVRTGGVDSGVSVLGAINGSNDFVVSGSTEGVAFSESSVFAFGQSNDSGTACYTGGELLETDGKWKTARLVPTTPSELNNISSLMLKFSGTAPYDFEINDISISYRTKSIK